MTQTALIFGVGAVEGLGAALAIRFAQEGLLAVVCGRTGERLETVVDLIASKGGQASSFVCDVTDAAGVSRAVAHAEALGPIALGVFNAGGNQPRAFLDSDPGFFERMWRVNALGAVNVGQAVVPSMVLRGQGTLLFTGATASLRARPPFIAFASAKAALRAVAQGMAREFGPQGLHVGHVVIDGMIDGERIATAWPEARARKPADGLLRLESIADAYWMLHQQHRSAWTHELDLRPYCETW